jgi:hypothetical protein
MRLSKRSKNVDCCSAANGYETPVIPWVDAMVFGVYAALQDVRIARFML